MAVVLAESLCGACVAQLFLICFIFGVMVIVARIQSNAEQDCLKKRQEITYSGGISTDKYSPSKVKWMIVSDAQV